MWGPNVVPDLPNHTSVYHMQGKLTTSCTITWVQFLCKIYRKYNMQFNNFIIFNQLDPIEYPNFLKFENYLLIIFCFYSSCHDHTFKYMLSLFLPSYLNIRQWNITIGCRKFPMLTIKCLTLIFWQYLKIISSDHINSSLKSSTLIQIQGDTSICGWCVTFTTKKQAHYI